MRKVAASLLLWLAVVVAAYSAERPTNIILMIGDGMGLAQLTAGKIAEGTLNIERMPYGGAITTYAANTLVTDSAASATAFATGHKTHKKMLSVSPDGKTLTTLFEYAEAQQKSTGLAVTSSVTHATPAAFVAHSASRSDHNGIAEQIAAANLEVLFGGGLGFFIPKRANGSLRIDEKNLVDILAQRMQITIDAAHFADIAPSAPAAALLAYNKPGHANTRQVSLADMTQKALTILSPNPKGFVLMVEGSQIDWAGHNNDLDWLLTELADFDAAVGVALDFAAQDRETLVVVTADHETGGMALLDKTVTATNVLEATFGLRGHTGAMVPLFAFGPGAAPLGGIKDNAQIGAMLIDYVRTEDD